MSSERAASGVDLLARLPALPELLGRGEGDQQPFLPGEVVELDDAVAVGGIGELEAQDLGVVLGLLQPLARRLVLGLGLDHGDGEVAGVAQEVVGPLLRAAADLLADDDDAAVGEGLLLGEGVRLVVPAGFDELGQDVLTAGVGFGGHGIGRPRWLYEADCL